MTPFFKFVVKDGGDVDEALGLCREIGIPRGKTFLMAQGATRAELDGNAPLVAQLAIENGCNYSDRLHIRLWGRERAR